MSTPPSQRPALIDPEFLLAGYASGYFPMADSRDGAIHWYSPDPRAIIPLDGFKISRSLRHALRTGRFGIRFNTEFEAVMRGCAAREETWISEEIIQSYLRIFRMGYAHSIETWDDNGLAGGLYGVSIGGAFFGESMFSRERDASKIALCHLVERLRNRGFELLDTQFQTPHLARFGTKEVARREYLRLLKHAVRLPRTFLD